MATQAQRSAATRGRILAAAEALFAQAGYHETSTDDIVDRANISRGALYHHFASKQTIFEAVFMQVAEQAILRAVEAAQSSPPSTPYEAVVQVSLRWLEEARNPRVAAIIIDQGPRVLGWQHARDLEARSSLRLMMSGLEQAAEAGEIGVESIEMAARFLNAIMAEAALVSLQGRPAVSVETIERAVRQVFDGLRRPVVAEVE